MSSYIDLTKPTIMLLVLFTGAAALVMEGSMLDHPWKFVLFIVGLYLTGGSANAFNQYLERDIDARMKRTQKRRPLPSKKLSPLQALVFSAGIGAAGVVLLGLIFNWLTALLSLGTILFYAFFYTLWLKPRTPQNIVIGGIAGAMAPVGAWAAATGTMAVLPWILFLIVFIWTPPHFWALALFCKEDYLEAKLPMLPVVKGDRSTLNQILFYSVFLVIISLLPLFYGVGWLYGLAAAGLGVGLIRKTLKARSAMEVRLFRGLFGYSIIYLFALFAAMVIDVLVRRAFAL